MLSLDCEHDCFEISLNALTGFEESCLSRWRHGCVHSFPALPAYSFWSLETVDKLQSTSYSSHIRHGTNVVSALQALYTFNSVRSFSYISNPFIGLISISSLETWLFFALRLPLCFERTSEIICSLFNTHSSLRIALWERKRAVIVILGTLGLGHWGLLWRGMFIVTASWDDAGGACVVTGTNPAFLNIVFFYSECLILDDTRQLISPS